MTVRPASPAERALVRAAARFVAARADSPASHC